MTPRSRFTSSTQRTASYASRQTLRSHHVHDLKGALGASIGRNFDVLSRTFWKLYQGKKK
jgi:hypothetical protein